ncbi:MAG: 50S ribosomal protein L24 [Verrucomicrobiota bacterium]|nr:50S ribosomal protein L24 [Verrucomicrobiota bacterium]
MAQKFHIKAGDVVVVVSGGASKLNENRGKVLRILPKKNRVLVEGLNMISKHAKKSQDNPNGGVIKREGSIHISNVMTVEKFEKSRAGQKKAADKK